MLPPSEGYRIANFSSETNTTTQVRAPPPQYRGVSRIINSRHGHASSNILASRLGSAPLSEPGFRGVVLGQLGESRPVAAIDTDIAGGKDGRKLAGPAKNSL